MDFRIVGVPPEMNRPIDQRTNRPVTASHVALDGQTIIAWVWGPDASCAYWSAAPANQTYDHGPGRMLDFDMENLAEVERRLTHWLKQKRKDVRRGLNSTVRALANEMAVRWNINMGQMNELKDAMNNTIPGMGCLFHYSVAIKRYHEIKDGQAQMRFQKAQEIRECCKEKHKEHAEAWY